MPLRKLTIQRKKSTLSLSGVFRSTSPAPLSRPLTPESVTSSMRRSAGRITSKILRSLLNRYRIQEPDFEMLTPPSRQVTPLSPPPTISKLAKTFVDSLTARKLSNFLVWMLYHDVVEYPTSPDSEYDAIEPMDMQGWLALGDFLSKFSKTMDTGYGLDLVVLDAICDRVPLQRSTVHSLLIQFADPSKMKFSTIATIVNTGEKEGKVELDVLRDVQLKLEELHKMAAKLKPEANTIFEAWHALVLKRLRDFSHVAVEPRIANIVSGTPLITAATNEHLPQEAKDGIELKYLYEVVQLERHVPLHRYGNHHNVPTPGVMTPLSSPPDAEDASSPAVDDAEYARKRNLQLMNENHDLRAQVMNLQRDLEKLQDSNDTLARKVSTLGRGQPPAYHQPQCATLTSESSPTLSSTSSHNAQDSTHAEPHTPCPPPRLRPRSRSYDTSEQLFSQSSLQAPSSSHIRHRSEILSWKYQDVFNEFDTPPSSPLRLSNPLTGELLEPRTTRVGGAGGGLGSGSGSGSGAGRRSGMVFTEGQKMLLAAVRDGDGEGAGEF
ncbi:hypothetical protein FB567DRAFT_346669 [Paraphoma chrysanthemicola]|uniref:Uncharacterized protein n=1 Tax=Paraphoma chrysanthemicola TaxID=798071 RepID=A0A8K0R5Z4_9PLEO|nr:hypothetical protein FB567DRAFT_346669 [Paraphoma chrysanthemicola]